MPRHSSVTRTLDGKVRLCINSIEHKLTEAAFIELMQDAVRVMQSIAKDRKQETV